MLSQTTPGHEARVHVGVAAAETVLSSCHGACMRSLLVTIQVNVPGSPQAVVAPTSWRSPNLPCLSSIHARQGAIET